MHFFLAKKKYVFIAKKSESREKVKKITYSNPTEMTFNIGEYPF